MELICRLTGCRFIRQIRRKVLFRAIDCLKTFDTIMVITSGGPGTASETLNIYIFQQAFDYFHMGYASSLIVIFLAIILGVALVLIKYRRQSLIEY